MDPNLLGGFVLIMNLTLLFFVIDISFNLRRVVRGMDQLWRKLSEINESLQKKI